MALPDQKSAVSAPAPAKEPLVAVKLLRATWDKETRMEVGTVIEVPITAALWGVVDGLFVPDGENPYKKG